MEDDERLEDELRELERRERELREEEAQIARERRARVRALGHGGAGHPRPGVLEEQEHAGRRERAEVRARSGASQEDGDDRSVGRRTRSPHRRRFGFLHAFALAFVALATLRLFLPPILERLIEARGSREGRFLVGDLDMNLWRGAYELEGVEIYRQEHAVPFFECALVDLSVHWGALARGAIVGEVVLHEPRLRAERAAEDAPPPDPEAPPGPDWREPFERLLPFRLDRLAVHDGELRFVDPSGDPTLDFFVSDLWLEATELGTYPEQADEPLEGTIELAGRPQGHGELEARVQIDPFADPPRFDLDLAVRKLALASLNDLLLRELAVDAEGGSIELFLEVAVQEGRVDGYVKTVLEGVELLGFQEIRNPADALAALWEALVAGAAEVIENQPHDRIATRAPIEGDAEQFGTDPWAIVTSLLRNAFVQAIRPGLDQSVGIEDVQDEPDPDEQPAAKEARDEPSGTEDEVQDEGEADEQPGAQEGAGDEPAAADHQAPSSEEQGRR